MLNFFTVKLFSTAILKKIDLKSGKLFVWIGTKKDHFEVKIGAQNLFFGLPKQFNTDLNRFKENVPVDEVKSKAYQVNTYQRRFKLKDTVLIWKVKFVLLPG